MAPWGPITWQFPGPAPNGAALRTEAKVDVGNHVATTLRVLEQRIRNSEGPGVRALEFTNCCVAP
jgi:hypothetical protein